MHLIMDRRKAVAERVTSPLHGWYRSRSSADEAGCVEVKFSDDDKRVLFRNSQDPNRQAVVSYNDYRKWLDRKKELRRRGPRRPSDGPAGRDHQFTSNQMTLIFSESEWEAFMDGVHEGEFDLPSGRKGTGTPLLRRIVASLALLGSVAYVGSGLTADLSEPEYVLAGAVVSASLGVLATDWYSHRAREEGELKG